MDEDSDICTLWPPGASANGIVTYAAQIIPALRQLGHEVFVLTPNCTAKADDPYTIDLNAIEFFTLAPVAINVSPSKLLIVYRHFGKKLAICNFNAHRTP